MNNRFYILTALLAFCTINIMAQDDDDDMYFGSSRIAAEKAPDASTMRSTYTEIVEDRHPSSYSAPERPTYYCGSIRDVDEYNRRGRYARHYTDSLGTGYGQDSILVSRQDYENALKMQKYDGYYNKVLVVVNDPWYNDPWYWDHYYWHTYWDDPWRNPWYDPYPWGWHAGWYGPGWYGPGWGFSWGVSWGVSWGWGRSWALGGPGWGGWRGPAVWGGGRVIARGGGSRFIPNSGRFATERRANGFASRNNYGGRTYGGVNNSMQRGSAFGNNSSFNNGSASRTNSFGGNSFSGGATRGGGFSGGGASRGGGFSGGGGGGFGGGGHGGRR